MISRQWLFTLGLLLTNSWGALAEPTAEFHASTASISEAADAILIPLKLSSGLTTAGFITFSTTDGTASAGQDYVSTSGRIAVVAGAYPVSTNSAVLRIPLLRDSVTEPDETFQVHLEGASGGVQLGA